MRVAVIGAGIGGLAVAAGLQREGHDVVVLERRTGPGAVGAGLTLFTNALTALDVMGLGEAVRRASDGPVARMRAGQRRPSGRWMTTLPPRSVAELRSIHRSDLHDVLLSCTHPGSVRTGHDALVARDGAPTVEIDGRDEPYDLVVAADGLRSESRERLGLGAGTRYAGYTAWRGVTARPVATNGEAGETWGRGRRFGVVPLPDGRVYWFATVSAPEHADLGPDLAAVRATFAGWHDPVLRCIEATPADAVLRHDIHDLAAPLPTFVRSRTVLLGDAAHAMTPDMGQGAAQALEDAATLVVLLRHVASSDDLPAALARYDAVRRPRTQALARRSRVMGRIGQLERAVPAALRDAALSAVPSALLGRATKATGGWAPPRA